jgi:hypothetical protein
MALLQEELLLLQLQRLLCLLPLHLLLQLLLQRRLLLLELLLQLLLLLLLLYLLLLLEQLLLELQCLLRCRSDWRCEQEQDCKPHIPDDAAVLDHGVSPPLPKSDISDFGQNSRLGLNALCEVACERIQQIYSRPLQVELRLTYWPGAPCSQPVGRNPFIAPLRRLPAHCAPWRGGWRNKAIAPYKGAGGQRIRRGLVGETSPLSVPFARQVSRGRYDTTISPGAYQDRARGARWCDHKALGRTVAIDRQAVTRTASGINRILCRCGS